MKKLVIPIFLFFNFSTFLFAQEVKEKELPSSENKTVIMPNKTQAVGDKVTIKDGATVLLEIENEGNAGSIRLPNINVDPIDDIKLYNSGGNLYWGLNQLGTSGSSNIWTRSGTSIYPSGLGDNIGIGTSSPAWELEVVNPRANEGSEIGVTANDAGGAIAAYSSTLPSPFQHFGGRVSLFANLTTLGLDLRADGATSDLRFYSGGAAPANERMRITQIGNVGIGNTNPQDKLHISGGDLRLDNYWKLGWGSDLNCIHGSSVENYLRFRTNGTDKMIITNLGYVGIGNLDPLYKLHVIDDGIEVATIYGSNNTYGGSGVLGIAYHFEGSGVFGYASGNNGSGIYGHAFANDVYAGYFAGKVNVTGALTKGSGSFKIDHPLDPANKNLYHSFVESPDMMNIYNGNVTTDGSGKSVVSLPEWFEALNKEFRYQLTVIGDFAQAIISEEIRNNQFAIKTDKPNIKVSWQVTGIRKDAFANANRIQVEEMKNEKDRGKYLHPEAFNMPRSAGVDYNERIENERLRTGEEYRTENLERQID